MSPISVKRPTQDSRGRPIRGTRVATQAAAPLADNLAGATSATSPWMLDQKSEGTCESDHALTPNRQFKKMLAYIRLFRRKASPVSVPEAAVFQRGVLVCQKFENVDLCLGGPNAT